MCQLPRWKEDVVLIKVWNRSLLNAFWKVISGSIHACYLVMVPLAPYSVSNHDSNSTRTPLSKDVVTLKWRSSKAWIDWYSFFCTPWTPWSVPWASLDYAGSNFFLLTLCLTFKMSTRSFLHGIWNEFIKKSKQKINMVTLKLFANE